MNKYKFFSQTDQPYKIRQHLLELLSEDLGINGCRRLASLLSDLAVENNVPGVAVILVLLSGTVGVDVFSEETTGVDMDAELLLEEATILEEDMDEELDDMISVAGSE